MKKSDIKKYELLSKELDKEFSGSIENTEPLTTEDEELLKNIIRRDEKKIPVTLRLEKWQVDMAKELANKTGLGYQTMLRQIISNDLIETKTMPCHECGENTLWKRSLIVRASEPNIKILQKLFPELKKNKYWYCTTHQTPLGTPKKLPTAS